MSSNNPTDARPAANEQSEDGAQSQNLLEAWDAGVVSEDIPLAEETRLPEATVDEAPLRAVADEAANEPAPAASRNAAPSSDDDLRPSGAPLAAGAGNGNARTEAGEQESVSGPSTAPRTERDARPDRGPRVEHERSKDRGEARPALSAPVAATGPADDEEIAPSFEDLGLSGALLKSIKDVGYEEPSPIQLRTIPVLLEGRDVIAQAQTGSGKTAAFGLPIIETIDPRNRRVQALILCPTRELAIQVAEALHKYGRHKEVETLPIYGGQPYERQFRGLQRGVQIVVGTPGRVMDHMRRGTLNLDAARFFVLDEADEMLDMGFIEDIEWILEQVPQERQTALFSATMPPRIVDLARNHMRDPETIRIAGKEMTVPEIRQSYFEVPRPRKVDALTRILDAEQPGSAMIFCRTKHGVDELGEALMARGYAVETLHGDLSQAQRDRVMRRFRGGQADVLIATDVAARGLDIPDVSHVINYDIPESAEAYVHRIGRTGRAGKSGEAITLITPKENRWLRQIERIVRARIEARRLPTAADVAERRREVMKEHILEVLKDQDAIAPYLDTIEDLADDRDTMEVAAAILKLYADETGRGTTPETMEDDVATYTAATGAFRRGDAPRGGSPRGEAGMTRLFLNVGRNQNVRPQDIVGAIANEARIPGKSIGAIDILDAYTFVDIPTEFSERVLEALRSTAIKGRPVNAEVAQPGGGRPAREDGGGAPGGRGGYQGDRGGFRGDRDGFRAHRGGFQDGPPRRDDRPGPPRFNRDRDDARGGFTRRFDRAEGGSENAGPPRFRFRREEGARGGGFASRGDGHGYPASRNQGDGSRQPGAGGRAFDRSHNRPERDVRGDRD